LCASLIGFNSHWFKALDLAVCVKSSCSVTSVTDSSCVAVHIGVDGMCFPGNCVKVDSGAFGSQSEQQNLYVICTYICEYSNFVLLTFMAHNSSYFVIDYAVYNLCYKLCVTVTVSRAVSLKELLTNCTVICQLFHIMACMSLSVSVDVLLRVLGFCAHYVFFFTQRQSLVCV